MWQSPARNGKNSNKKRNMSSSSTSKSSSSTCSSETRNNCNPRKTMEEVWKDINLSCLKDSPSTIISNTNNNHHAFPCMILQDFLARPFEKDPPITKSRAIDHNHFLNSSRRRPAPTLLCLNNSSSESDFHNIENSVPIRGSGSGSGSGSGRSHHHLLRTPPVFGSSCLISPFHLLGSSSLLHSNICKKRPQQEHDDSSDRRHKRLIKNRESAARSRDKKQAYTLKLEQEVNKLMEENDRLRRQQEKFLAPPAQHPKKNNLYRTSTAPF